MGRPEGKRPHGKPRRIWDYTVKKDLEEIRCKGVGLIHLAQQGIR